MNHKNLYYFLFFSRAKIFFSLIFVLPVISFAHPDYDLDEFDDLGLDPLNKSNNKPIRKNNVKKKVLLFDDNLYLLDDDFNLGDDEYDLQKLELNPNDIDTAKEYEAFLNAFFYNSTPVGANPTINTTASKTIKSKKSNPTNHKAKSSQTPPSKRNNKELSTNSRSINTGSLGFGISTIIGATIPIGQNLATFGLGSNFGISLNSPFSFNIGGRTSNVGTDIYFSSMSSTTGNKYKLTNIIGNVSISPSQSIEIKAGIGLSPATIDPYSTLALSFPIDVNYYLPKSFSGFRIALNLHAQMTLGYPNDGSNDGGSAATTEFINAGLFINTPFGF